MSEPSSLDSLLERQLHGWNIVVWNGANEIDLEKSVSGLAASSRNHFIAMDPDRAWSQPGRDRSLIKIITDFLSPGISPRERSMIRNSIEHEQL